MSAGFPSMLNHAWVVDMSLDDKVDPSLIKLVADGLETVSLACERISEPENQYPKDDRLRAVKYLCVYEQSVQFKGMNDELREGFEYFSKIVQDKAKHPMSDNYLYVGLSGLVAGGMAVYFKSPLMIGMSGMLVVYSLYRAYTLNRDEKKKVKDAREKVMHANDATWDEALTMLRDKRHRNEYRND